jgi:hypothetical protein
MKYFYQVIVRTVTLILLLSVVSACADQESKPMKKGSGGSIGTGSEQNADKKKNVTPTAVVIGGAQIKIDMYAWIPGAGGTDLQTEKGEAVLVFDRQDGPPKVFIVHGAGFVTWKEEAKFDVCSWTAKAEGRLKVQGVLDPNNCQAQLVITEIFDDPVVTSSSGPCGSDLEFTKNKWVHRVDLPLVNNTSAMTGSSPYDLKVTIYDILLDDSIACIVP